jgi:protein-ribulosamine 3-kinase
VLPFAAIARQIAALCAAPCAPAPACSVGDNCYRWSVGATALFVKTASGERLAAFEAESAGLAELCAAGALRVPQVRACAVAEGTAFLALEWLESAPADERCLRRLGAGLAAQHRVTAPAYGWQRANTIGRTPQCNDWSADWAQFFVERRLRPQLCLVAANGFADGVAARGEQLLQACAALLAGHRPAPSLLHGDLWGGNWLSCGGEPVIFDPAVYFGDREADLAMTRLFGGFAAPFYEAYEAAAPLPSGAPLRAELYNLYHLLNHVNLFGRAYVRQARASIERVLAAVRG